MDTDTNTTDTDTTETAMNAEWTIALDSTNSSEFITKGKTKHCVRVERGATYDLEWGRQEFKGPHMFIDNTYGCDIDVFFNTYKAIEGEEDTFIKVAKVWAYQVDTDTDLVTMVDGKEKSRSTVLANDWIIQNPGGEQHYNTHEEFVQRYKLVV